MAPECLRKVAGALVAKTAIKMRHLSSSEKFVSSCIPRVHRSGPTALMIDFHLATSVCFSMSMQIACFGQASLLRRARLTLHASLTSCSWVEMALGSGMGAGRVTRILSPRKGTRRSHMSKLVFDFSQKGMFLFVADTAEVRQERVARAGGLFAVVGCGPNSTDSNDGWSQRLLPRVPWHHPPAPNQSCGGIGRCKRR